MIEAGASNLLHVTAERGSHDFEALEETLRGLASSSFPSGFSLVVVDSDGPLFGAYGGLACRVGTVSPITASTLYDLASLTKVVCSVSLAAVFAERGLLSLGDPVARWLPQFPQSDTTLLHLMTHTSGLTDERFFERMVGQRAIAQAIVERAAGSTPSGEVFYADTNFMLLGWVLEACGQASLDQLFTREVAAPLGMARTSFRPLLNAETAATELDGDQRLVPGLVWGEVHDGNAFALGGIAGHAGLFAPLEDLVTFTRHLLRPDGRVFGTDAVEAFATRRAGRSPDVRGLGWRLAPEGWGSWPEGTLWHTGFTGTSLLVSRELDLGVVLLTNAIHPNRRVEDQADVRALIHRRVREALT